MAYRPQPARTEELDKETDAFVLNVVRYLDSSSDYREYLPYPHSPAPIHNEELTILDNIPGDVRASLWRVTFYVILVAVVLLGLLRVDF
jgi:hypothetical protein